MKYAGIPMGMWALFKNSFKKQLSVALGFDADSAGRITRLAKPKYKEIIKSLPEFEKEDDFAMNIVSAAMLASFYLNMPQKPSVEQMTDYYAAAMMIKPMKWFCRQEGKKKFTEDDIREMKRKAAARFADRNSYSWNMEFLPYQDGSGYEARFDRCGICALMKKLGIYEMTPAMCHLDYDMTEAGETAEFVREYTLASGGPYCDCGYKRK